MLDELNLKGMLEETPPRDVALAGLFSLLLAVLGFVALAWDPPVTLLVWSSIPILFWGALFRRMLWHPEWAAGSLSAALTGVVVAFGWKSIFAGPSLTLAVLGIGESVVAYVGYRTYRWFARLRNLAERRPMAVDSGLVG